VGVGPGLMDKRSVGDWIVEREHLFEMRSGWPELSAIHQASSRGQMAENQPGGMVALTAQTQQILGQTLRQIVFATKCVME
jgi:hypothetical protein